LSGKTTPAYMAPEMIAEKPCTTKVDMWALGVILYQFFSNQLPFEDAKSKGKIYSINRSASIGQQPQDISVLQISAGTNINIDTMKQISENEPAPLPSTVPPFIKEIIAKLLDKNPKNRPDAKGLLNKDEIKPYIQKIIT
jgi:serine/threonine protein kinase